eukprot:Blabericola_migrator_1__8728@NODE_45_length_16846_cov_82_345015_g41_i0_p7_GENE_NODE_45_length_16846_cov_82_345015_g41_i0NODE_45_length_16846_cov_82_345015_g41_i0_p7_ORF_typecomplete_len262_score82_15HMMR_N/PF15905_5/5_3e06Myosin_tail_1/PF01576_19/0_00025HOOK/PF05622_12/0_00026CCCAP/PF15964_5/0_021CCCAP/PF15964_5/2_7DUF745/PF05335_13/0_31DUF745/PF05335_13/0_013AAA_13/PF13166_6/0_0015TPR_MLP1_2/PF07926_12/1_6TPR_MLP1_2/PF07926_12/0_0054TPR_MLP1_2/PF07926_12/4_3e02CENPF_leu_zip/PF10473_9/4_2CENPF_l
MTAKYKKAQDALNSQKHKLNSLEQELQMIKNQVEQNKEQIIDDPEHLRKAHQLATATVREAQQQLVEIESALSVQRDIERLSGHIRKFTERLDGSMSNIDSAVKEYRTLQEELHTLQGEMEQSEKAYKYKENEIRAQITMVREKRDAAKQRVNNIEQVNANSLQREREKKKEIDNYTNLATREEQLCREVETQSEGDFRHFTTLRSKLEETMNIHSRCVIDLEGMRSAFSKELFNAHGDMASMANEFKLTLINLAKECSSQ